MTDIGQGSVLDVGGNILAKGKTRHCQDWEKYQRNKKVRRGKVKTRGKK